MAIKKIFKTEEEWKKVLSPDEYKILRQGSTEVPFTGCLLHTKSKGNYVCGACGNVIFSSKDKFESGTGWPSFSQLAKKESVEIKPDFSLGIPREEVLCARCGSHLGHVFNDGPPPTGKRYCINSLALKFKQAKAKK